MYRAIYLTDKGSEFKVQGSAPPLDRKAASLIGKETLQFGIGFFVDCGSGF